MKRKQLLKSHAGGLEIQDKSTVSKVEPCEKRHSSYRSHQESDVAHF